MFQDKISDISGDMAVLSIDKILYDSGFSIAGSDIDCDYLYEVFYDAVYAMDGDYDEDEDINCCIYTFRGKSIKEYVRLALKYGRLNGIIKAINLFDNSSVGIVSILKIAYIVHICSGCYAARVIIRICKIISVSITYIYEIIINI